METIFPTDTGYKGLFFVGWHRSAAGEITRTGTAVIKRTYDVASDGANPAAGRLTPSGNALPVFLQDQPEALVQNGDFKAGTGSWVPDAGVTLTQQAGSNPFAAVSGAVNAGVRQTIDLESPLRGRGFVLSFKAKANVATSLANVRLEAGARSICSISKPLTTDWQTFGQADVWPNDVGATSFRVVLRTATDAGRVVNYDDVTVTHINYESDLVADKPGGDVIVLPTRAIVPREVLIDGVAMLRRPAAEASLLRTFGWERRDDGPRKTAGHFPDDPNAYPLPKPLPAAFENAYYNGYRRAVRAEVNTTLPPHLARDAIVTIRRSGAGDYGFRLGGERVSAAYYVYSGIGPDAEARWQGHNVAMNLDTLVVEPDDNRCYAVWRGVWEFDERAEESYRRLVVSVA